MPIMFTSKGFHLENDGILSKLVLLLDSILRGIGQIMFQNNSYTGILFLIGIFYNSTQSGLMTFFGASISTITAFILGSDSSLIKNGVFGFNGALTAIALATFLPFSLPTLVYITIASAMSTIIMSALIRLFSFIKMPVLTAPFVFVTLCFLLGYVHFNPLQSTHFISKANLQEQISLENFLTITTFTEGLYTGVSQVFFQENTITGIIILIGLFINSQKCFAMALIGSIIGLFTVYLFGIPESVIRSGAYNFNSVLTAIALGSIFFHLNLYSLAYAVSGIIITCIISAALSTAFISIGMPVMTLPFVVATWLYVLASFNFSFIKSK